MTTEGRSTVVTIRGLIKTCGAGESKVEALRGVELDIEAGEFSAIMGPSGSGKSTLLHLIGGLDAADGGVIQIDGRDLGTMDDDELTMLRRRRIGFVFQAFNLLSVLTAEENVALPLAVDGIPEAEANRRATRALDRVGLADRRGHLPLELSGGEQQRVAVARALVNEPALLLADEPTGNLDSRNADQVISLLRELVDDAGQSILMVTHNAAHAAIADRIIRLRDGCVVDEQRMPRGRSPDEVLHDLGAAP